MGTKLEREPDGDTLIPAKIVKAIDIHLPSLGMNVHAPGVRPHLFRDQ